MVDDFFMEISCIYSETYPAYKGVHLCVEFAEPPQNLVSSLLGGEPHWIRSPSGGSPP